MRMAPKAGLSPPADSPVAAEESRRVPMPAELKAEIRRLLAEALIADVGADQEADREKDRP
jgi:hypothetical protein